MTRASYRRRVNPTVAAFEAAASAEVAADRVADLLDAVEELFASGVSRPRARRLLARIAEAAVAADRAVRDTDAAWWDIRNATVRQFIRERRSLPHIFEAVVVVNITQPDNKEES